MEDKLTPPEAKKGNSKIPLIIVLLLLLLAAGYAGMLFTEKGDLEKQLQNCEATSTEIQEEKTRVISELEAMKVQYDTLYANNDHLSEELLAEREKIEELIQQAKNKNWTIAKLRKETQTLRVIMQGYVQTIDSLNTLNETLVVEKAEINKKLGEEKNKTTNLTKEKEELSTMVRIGQRMEALDVMVIAQRVKSNNVHRETSKASKTNKLKVCFTLNKNEIADAGTKVIHVRIIAPDATILPANDDTDGKFEFGGGASAFYSLKREVKYSNVELDQCFYYEVIGSIPSGKYICEIYCAGADIGKTTITLK
jgi:flagellar basal body-associated protein FliL